MSRDDAHVQIPLRLVCAECDRLAPEGARGWRAYLTDDEPPEIANYCPDCAEREFDD
jgi:hypothetical protein